MRSFIAKVCICAAIIGYATTVEAYNYITLLGKDVGGNMLCSDWNHQPSRGQRAAMVQWVFGFVTGYDAAIRPGPSKGGLNGPPLGNSIDSLCKQYPNADLASIANNISEYIQKEIDGEVSSPIILNREALAPPKTDPDRWVIVKNETTKVCSVVTNRPARDNSMILTSFKAFTVGSKAVKDMVASECGCEKDCHFELPR